jgi:hypothetical protein
MLGGDELIFEAAGFLKGALKDFVERLGGIEAGLGRHADLGEVPELGFAFSDDGVRLYAALFKDRANDAFGFLGEGDEEMQRVEHLAVGLAGHLLRFLEGFLGFLRELVESDHGAPIFFRLSAALFGGDQDENGRRTFRPPP